MPRWSFDETEVVPEAPSIEVSVEDNPVVAELLGPDGEQLAVLLERPVIGFGFAAVPKVATRVVRPEEW